MTDSKISRFLKYRRLKRISRKILLNGEEESRKDPNHYTSWFYKCIIEKKKLQWFIQQLPDLYLISLKKDKISPLYFWFVKDEIQLISVEYIAPVSPQNVDFICPTQKDLDKIDKWANEHSLNRFYFNSEQNKIFSINLYPYLKREIICGSPLPKYKIIDGVHRFGYAKINNIQSVLAIIENIYICKKEWVTSLFQIVKKK